GGDRRQRTEPGEGLGPLERTEEAGRRSPQGVRRLPRGVNGGVSRRLRGPQLGRESCSGRLSPGEAQASSPTAGKVHEGRQTTARGCATSTARMGSRQPSKRHRVRAPFIPARESVSPTGEEAGDLLPGHETCMLTELTLLSGGEVSRSARAPSIG